jgi:hypothetical protein
MRRLLVVLLLCLSCVAAFAKDSSPHQSKWVYFGRDGKLVYTQSPRGDRIPDFSWAGYRGGGVALPQVAVRVKVSRQAEPTIRLRFRGRWMRW